VGIDRIFAGLSGNRVSNAVTGNLTAKVMILGFHTISLLLHDECTAAKELAALGYRCVAIRPKLGGLDPHHDRFMERILQFSEIARAADLQIVVDAEGEFMHQPRVLQGPSLASDDPQEADLAQAWIERWIGVADDLRCSLITFSSGARAKTDVDEATLERLAARVETLVERAQGVKLAVRPAAGDAIATVAQFERMKQWLGKETKIGVAADVGEMLVAGEFPVGDRLARNLDDVACVYLCEPGMTRSHDRRVGQGDVDLSRVVQSLERHGYRGPAIVRVQGHSELGLLLAEEAVEFLHHP
jgi:sugar phosphate isomerase/epimerase